MVTDEMLAELAKLRNAVNWRDVATMLGCRSWSHLPHCNESHRCNDTSILVELEQFGQVEFRRQVGRDGDRAAPPMRGVGVQFRRPNGRWDIRLTEAGFATLERGPSRPWER